MIDVLSIASEVFPLIKTGGLADVAGALPKALKPQGIAMRTLMPGYPQVMQRRAEARVKWLLADIDASDAQQKKIAELMTATMTDLRPLRQQARDARREAMQLLAQPQIDRGALEALRAKQAQAMELISRRITQSLADAAEVLTPEQRAKLAARMERRHGPRRG